MKPCFTITDHLSVIGLALLATARMTRPSKALSDADDLRYEIRKL